MKKSESENIKMYNFPFSYDGEYINVEETFNEDWINFYFGIGGRGMGKTYQTGRYLLRNNKKFVMCRRTDTEIQTLCENDKGTRELSNNPFNQLSLDTGIVLKAIKEGKENYGIFKVPKWDYDPKEDTKESICRLMAIKSVAKTKGFSIPNIDYIFWDEFIPVTKVRDGNEDGYDYQQLYETIARNNEMSKGVPVKSICMANATTITNSVFCEFGIINYVSEMVRKGYNCLDLPDRGIRVILFPDTTSFTEKKRQTALYRAIPKTSRMYKSSIENDFVLDDYTDVGKIQLAHYKPNAIITNGIFTYMIYCHDTKGYYFSDIISGKPLKNNIFDLNVDSQREGAKYYLKEFYDCYIDGYIKFCDMQSKTLFKQILNK